MAAQVSIIGIGMTEMSTRDRSVNALAVEAVEEALHDAGLAPGQVGLVVFANSLGGRLSDQGCIRGQAWLKDAGLSGAGVVNVDNSCASGSSALHMAFLAVHAGESPVLAVGVEKMWTGDREATIGAIEDALPADERPDLRDRLAVEASGSVFMGFNSMWAKEQIASRGTTLDEMAATASKAYALGASNPLAQHRKPLGADEILASRVIAPPLTRLMCSSFTDGAAAVVVAGGKVAGAPRIRESVLRSGSGELEYHARMAQVLSESWNLAGMEPGDVDVLEVHDATSAEELYALEALGFFDTGMAGAATARGETLPAATRTCVNPSGGLVARGHALAATGICQVVELAIQLRGHAGERQQPGARIGAAVNTGGIVRGDAATVGIHVLERG